MHWHSITLMLVFAALPLHAADLSSTLRSISSTYDLEIFVEEGLEHEDAAPIPDNARTLEQVLRRTLRGYSHAVRYAGETPVELRVFVSGTGAMNRITAPRSVAGDIPGPAPQTSPAFHATNVGAAPGAPPSITPTLHRPHGPPTAPGVRRTASGYAYRNTSLGKMPVRQAFNKPSISHRSRTAPPYPVAQSNTPDTTKRRQEQLLTRSAMLREFSLQAQTQN